MAESVGRNVVCDELPYCKREKMANTNVRLSRIRAVLAVILSSTRTRASEKRPVIVPMYRQTANEISSGANNLSVIIQWPKDSRRKCSQWDMSSLALLRASFPDLGLSDPPRLLRAKCTGSRIPSGSPAILARCTYEALPLTAIATRYE